MKVTVKVPMTKRYNLNRDIAEMLSLAARHEIYAGHARNYLLSGQQVPLVHIPAVIRALEAKEWFDDIDTTVSLMITASWTNWEITGAEFRLIQELKKAEVNSSVGVRFLRSQYNWGLKEAKDVYDNIHTNES